MLIKNFIKVATFLKRYAERGLLLTPAFLMAQSPSQTTTITLEEVSIEAIKLESTRFLSPSSVSVINLIPIQGLQQQLSLQEYLGAIPGLFSLNANNYAQDL